MPRVLVFDSGAGGLSVAKEILTRLPQIELIYVADNAFYPYGTKVDAQLTPRIISQVNRLVDQMKPDLVVVACNTASTLALASLRKARTCPFVGVVPAVKPAAALSQTKVIGLLATSATLRRSYTRELILDFAADCKVVMHPGDRIVDIAEQKIAHGTCNNEALQRELSGLFAQSQHIDTVVLACTHFPLLKEELVLLDTAANRVIQWIDSGEAIARRVAYLLRLTRQENASSKVEIVLTEDSSETEKIRSRYYRYLVE